VILVGFEHPLARRSRRRPGGWRPDPVYPDPDCQRAMCARLALTLERVNACLPEAERYRPDIALAPRNADRAALSFSPEQIDLIGASLGGEIRRLRLALAASGQGAGAFHPGGGP